MNNKHMIRVERFYGAIKLVGYIYICMYIYRHAEKYDA